jgi:amino acid permease
MNFISFDNVKWYDWFWLVPFIIFAFTYSFVMTKILRR